MDRAKYFDGIGVHWYGGLNTVNLDNAHSFAPDKFLLATEACNCPGVVYKANAREWWQRAEHLGMDILQDRSATPEVHGAPADAGELRELRVLRPGGVPAEL